MTAHDILTLEEVAAYLRVSERTVYDWANKGEIPCGKLGTTWRFKRSEVERWVDATSGSPARLFGLDGVKGAVRPGLDADLVVFDPGATRRLDAANLHSRCDHSPYAGLEVTGWPAVTISRGDVVAVGGEPADPRPGRGRFVRRTPLRP